ncbi:hypothetical protein [Microbacterium amylolyticum]|uniref:Uncharacterized protein n=1 Tax=Microbacterium amylolyticum TaxID=936337 RepID=A0ABS4ZKK0_9MICO|nr:hypothetical protein [Microbacterium amylolyticum]MBP2437811.1 hypothetical protein [Microbacterium amylolyticum]
MFAKLFTTSPNTSHHLRTAFGDVDDHHERGDVPGWVLVTLMTAGLVVVIWALAGPVLTSVFQQAIDRVTAL